MAYRISVKGKESPASGVENEPLPPSDRNKLGKGKEQSSPQRGSVMGRVINYVGVKCLSTALCIQ